MTQSIYKAKEIKNDERNIPSLEMVHTELSKWYLGWAKATQEWDPNFRGPEHAHFLHWNQMREQKLSLNRKGQWKILTKKSLSHDLIFDFENPNQIQVILTLK